MDISSINTNSASLTQMLGGVSVKDHETAVLKIANDQFKQEGKNALKLVESAQVPEAPKPQGPLGNHLDVKA